MIHLGGVYMQISSRLSRPLNQNFIDDIGEAVIIYLMSSTIIEILTLKNVVKDDIPAVINGWISEYQRLYERDAVTKYIQKHQLNMASTIMNTFNIVDIRDEDLEKDSYNAVKIQHAVSGDMAYFPASTTFRRKMQTSGRAIFGDSIEEFDVAVQGMIPGNPYMPMHNLFHYNENRNRIRYFSSLAETGGSMVYMSAEPYEENTLSDFLKEVKGKVLICGCGIGYSAYKAALLDRVDDITILESSPDVINLFKSQALPYFPRSVDVQECDAYEFLEREDLSNYNCVYVDTWYDTNDMIDAYLRCLILEDKYPNTKFIYWLEKKLFLDVKMAILRYIYEQVSRETINFPYYPMISKLSKELIDFDRTMINSQESLDLLISDDNLRRLLKTFAKMHPEKATEFTYHENPKGIQLKKWKSFKY